MNKLSISLAGSILFSAYASLAQQTQNYLSKYNSSPPTTINSQIFDNGSFVSVGANTQISGELMNIRKDQNGWTALRIYNNTSGSAASAALTVNGGATGIGVAAYSAGYLSTIGSIFQPNTGVINCGLNLNIGTTASYPMSFFTNGVNRMTVDNAGNVGIGTSGPPQKFSLLGGNMTWGNTAFSNQLGYDQGGNVELGGTNTAANPNSGGTPYIDFHYGTGSAQDYNARLINSQNNRLEINLGNNFGMAARYNSSKSMTQVIIGPDTILPGTTHDDFRLSVDGKIVAKSMYVTTSNWADYVFNKDYKLKSLNEVETFIKNNNHLPEVPSASEVEKQGVNVGDMDAILLKKIEELTLYIIEQNKKLEQQGRHITELEKTRK